MFLTIHFQPFTRFPILVHLEFAFFQAQELTSGLLMTWDKLFCTVRLTGACRALTWVVLAMPAQVHFRGEAEGRTPSGLLQVVCLPTQSRNYIQPFGGCANALFSEPFSTLEIISFCHLFTSLLLLAE